MKEHESIRRLTLWVQSWKRYRYAALILLLGVALMVLPREKQTEPEISDTRAEEPDDVEARLEELLGQIDGAGQVRVMLTLREGTRYTYQTDDQLQTEQDRQEQERRTVLVSGTDGAETPVIAATTCPVYQGAVVVCEGADSAFVKLSIVNAVSDLTGLGSDKISVIKMKSS